MEPVVMGEKEALAQLFHLFQLAFPSVSWNHLGPSF
jgi:hypothetical protein